jgi:hypothetical protein
MKFLRILFLVIIFLLMHLAWKNDNNYKSKSIVKDTSVENLTSSTIDFNIKK